MKNTIKKNNYKIIVALLLIVTSFFYYAQPVLANHFTNSKLFTGTEDLIADTTTGFSTLMVVVSIVAVIYFQIRKAISDEMDHKKCCARKCA